MNVQRKLVREWADRIEETPIDWLWRPWIPRGVVSVVDGEPGAGKSALMFDLIARITTGRPMPQLGDPGEDHAEVGGQRSETVSRDAESSERSAPSPTPTPAATPGPTDSTGKLVAPSTPSRPPGKVLLVPLEDPVKLAVAPRLHSAGADQGNVIILRKVAHPGAAMSWTPIQLPRDLDLIAAECAELRPELLVLDPFFAALGVDEKNRFIQINDEQSIRRVVARLKLLAEEFNVAIVLIRHLNKASGGSALLRGSGSIAIAAQARSVMLVAKDQLAPDRRILAMVKTNLDAMPCSLSFLSTRNSLGSTIRWMGPCEHSADELVRRMDGKTISPAVQNAMNFLKTTLYGCSGRTWAELTELAARQGIPEITLRRARDELRLEKKAKGKDIVVWSLPPRVQTQMRVQWGWTK
jgi:AAA domain